MKEFIYNGCDLGSVTTFAYSHLVGFTIASDCKKSIFSINFNGCSYMKYSQTHSYSLVHIINEYS